MLRRKDSFHESFRRHLYTGDASQPKGGNATLTHSLHCHPLLLMVVSQQLWLPTWSDPARFNKRLCLGQDFQALQCFWVLSFRQVWFFRGHPGIQCPSHFTFNHDSFESTPQPGCCSGTHIFLPQNPLWWSDSWLVLHLYSQSGLCIPSVTETERPIFWCAAEQRQGSTFLTCCWKAPE